MKHIRGLSFSLKIVTTIILTLVLNFCFSFHLNNSLSLNKYKVYVECTYFQKGSMQLYFDTGNNFNELQKINLEVEKGENILEFTLELKTKEKLKNLRLDFGNDQKLDSLKLTAFRLTHDRSSIISLNKEKVESNISYYSDNFIEDGITIIKKQESKKILDPYIVYSPLNELVHPKWLRVLFLIFPWLLFFIIPVVKWIRNTVKNNDTVLVFIALFICTIPLKIAWITFTSLLIFISALFMFYKRRSLKFSINHYFLSFFIIVPILFLGNGMLSKTIMPLGLLLWIFSGAILNTNININQVKLIYVKVFTIVIAITFCSWVNLVLFEGYFYDVSLSNYFHLVKWKFHYVLYWLYYDHPNFLSFFVSIGAIFCFDLYRQRVLNKNFGLLYGFLALIFMLLLGSRFALLGLLCIPILYVIPIKLLSRYMLPIWGLLSAFIINFISYIDFQRNQIWSLSFHAIKQKPWFGYGTGMSSKVLPDKIIVNQNGLDGLLEINHSHNQIISYVLENGILGALLILFCFFVIIHRFGKEGNRSMLIVTFMVLFLMIVEGPFRTTTPLNVIGFLYAIIGNKIILKKN